jgi:hypothetical protein
MVKEQAEQDTCVKAGGKHKMSVDFQQTTQRYIPEDSTLHNHCCENLKSHMK